MLCLHLLSSRLRAVFEILREEGVSVFKDARDVAQVMSNDGLKSRLGRDKLKTLTLLCKFFEQPRVSLVGRRLAA